MAIIIPPGFCQITTHFHAGSNNQACNNVFGAELDSPLDQTTVDEFSVALSVIYLDWLAGGATYDGLTILEGNDGPPLLWQSFGGIGTSVNPNDTCPPNVQVIIDKKTGFSGRKFRGRTYLPDVDEENVGSDGVLDSDALLAAQAFADGITTNLSSTPFVQQVLLHTARPGPDPAPTPVASYTVTPRVATLRPRFKRS